MTRAEMQTFYDAQDRLTPAELASFVTWCQQHAYRPSLLRLQQWREWRA
jgi:hypothetical protein